jgi:hypothetical protein
MKKPTIVTNYPNWSNNNINDLIQKNDGKDVISFHTWGKN